MNTPDTDQRGVLPMTFDDEIAAWQHRMHDAMLSMNHSWDLLDSMSLKPFGEHAKHAAVRACIDDAVTLMRRAAARSDASNFANWIRSLPTPPQPVVPEDVRKDAAAVVASQRAYTPESVTMANWILSLPAAPQPPERSAAQVGNETLQELAHEAECIRADTDYDDSRATVVLLSIIAKMLARLGGEGQGGQAS